MDHAICTLAASRVTCKSCDDQPTFNRFSSMVSRHEIGCINKTDRYNPHERIQNIGGRNADGTTWKITEEEAIAGIESAKWAFYVSQNGRTVDVIIARSAFGHKYLKTVADGQHPDNLLSLPECR